MSNTLLVTIALSLQYMTCLDHGYLERGYVSASSFDIPLLHCQTIESPFLVVVPVILTVVILFGISQLVERVTGYRFFQTRHRKHGFGLFEQVSSTPGSPKPNQLPMVPWFSLSLTATAIQLLVTLQIFVGRLDIRHILKSLCKDDQDIVYDLRSSDSWLDFFADGGDGFNSSYTIARMLAQPNLCVVVPKSIRQRIAATSANNSGSNTPRVTRSTRKKTPTATSLFTDTHIAASMVIQRRATNPLNLAQISPSRNETVILPRASVVVHGGDLAYPRPSYEFYKTRFVDPIEAAFPPGPGGGAAGSRPRMFVVPGNHDWYDSCESFIHWIIGKVSLGGWKLPQRNSYYALQLRSGWWLLAMDLALTNDVDVFQYQEFSRIIEEKIEEFDRVLVVTHRPQWVFDPYHDTFTGDLFHQLLDKIGPTRLAMRLAGDIHHYSRYSGGHGLPQLVISGGGGAFLHPTHVPEQGIVYDYFDDWETRKGKIGLIDEESEEDELQPLSPMSPSKNGGRKFPTKRPHAQASRSNNYYRYNRVCAFPSEDVSRKLPWLNPLHFRDRNWGADLIMGIVYVCMGISVLPICQANLVIEAIESASTVSKSLLSGLYVFTTHLVIPSMKLIWTDSWFSLSSQVVFFAMCFASIGDTRYSVWRRILHAFIHFLTHAICSVILFAFIELAIEFLAQISLGRDSVITDGFRVPGIVSVTDTFVFGSPILESLLGSFLRFVDLPSSLIRNRASLCAVVPAPRELLFRYYTRIVPFFWVMATPIAAFVMGCYLLISLNVFGIHLTEAFSSLRIEDFKHFLRMYIDPETDDLHVYVVGIEKVPRNWEEDPAWDPKIFAAANQPLPPSSKWVTPSRWRPSHKGHEPMLVDYFVVPGPKRNAATNLLCDSPIE